MADNGTTNSKITPQQQRAVAALLSSKSVAEAAKQTGVSLRTMFRWMNDDPAFKVALSAAESALIDAATRRLLAHQEHALTVILSIMADKQYAAGVRLRAAMAVVDYMLKLRELRNIEDRLTALEEAYAGQTR
jgi:hypothetical protein